MVYFTLQPPQPQPPPPNQKKKIFTPMAASSQFLLLFSNFIYLVNILQAQSLQLQPNAIVLPVVKDASTLQYVARIYHGASQIPVKLVLDLGGPLIWLDCGSSSASSSRRLIPSQSIQCSRTGTARDRGSKTCDVFAENGITGFVTRGELVEDTIALISTGGSKVDSVNQFLFSCSPSFLLQGMATGARGMLGLGRAPISLSSQLASSIGHHRKFFMCLSSSKGVVFSHNGPLDSMFGTETSRLSLMYTPFTGTSPDYFINIKSIKINGNPLSLTVKGLTKLSTIVPYTTMESSIYATFSKAFLKAATSRNMTRVAALAPFGLCFSSKGIDESAVPVIDLVLQSEMVKWRIYGWNSVVWVNQEVMCLAFLDGGSDLTSSVVIGGFQLEDNLLDFDLATSMLGFTSFRQTSCSNFVPEPVLKDSL